MILYFVHTIYNTKHAGAAFIKKKIALSIFLYTSKLKEYF